MTTLFRGKSNGGIFSELDGLGVPAADSAAGALVARKLEGRVNFAFSWTMATTKLHLSQEVGGFGAIANHHSDDFELGNHIARERPSGCVHAQACVDGISQRDFFAIACNMSFDGRSGCGTFGRRAIWGRLLTFGLAWSVLAAIVAPSIGIAAAYLGTYLVLSLAMAWTVGVWGIGDPITRRSLWLVPVRDALNISIWIAGVFSYNFSWRGSMFRVKDGLLVPVPDAPVPVNSGPVINEPTPSS